MQVRLRLALFLTIAALSLPALAAPNFARYPLRVNILGSTANNYWVNPTLGGTALDVGAMATAGGGEGAPAAPMGGGLSLNYDPVQMFYGNGKANLVSPTEPTLLGYTFTYTECMGRLGMTLPDKPFYARWKKKNNILELLVPLENTKPVKPGSKPPATKYDKCDMTYTPSPYIYLLMQNGAILNITPADLAKKPALKQYTVGLDPKLRLRTPAPAANPARRPLRPAPARPASNPGSAASDSSPTRPNPTQ